MHILYDVCTMYKVCVCRIGSPSALFSDGYAKIKLISQIDTIPTKI